MELWKTNRKLFLIQDQSKNNQPDSSRNRPSSFQVARRLHRKHLDDPFCLTRAIRQTGNGPRPVHPWPWGQVRGVRTESWLNEWSTLLIQSWNVSNTRWQKRWDQIWKKKWQKNSRDISLFPNHFYLQKLFSRSIFLCKFWHTKIVLEFTIPPNVITDFTVAFLFFQIIKSANISPYFLNYGNGLCITWNCNGDESLAGDLCTITDVVFENRHRRDISVLSPQNSQRIDAHTVALPFQLQVCSWQFTIIYWSHVDNERSLFLFFFFGLKCCWHKCDFDAGLRMSTWREFPNKRGQTAAVTMTLSKRAQWCLHVSSEFWKWWEFK